MKCFQKASHHKLLKLQYRFWVLSRKMRKVRLRLREINDLSLYPGTHLIIPRNIGNGAILSCQAILNFVCFLIFDIDCSDQ